MLFITILDFEKGEVFIFDISEASNTMDFENIAEFIEEEHDLIFRETDCQWLITEKLLLQIL
jgi:hypothetical protein